MNKEEYFGNIKSYKFLANKSLGQNFLVSPDIAESIVDSLNISDSDITLEIGAGLGSLSYFLSKKEGKSALIDVDDNMINILNEKFAHAKNIEIIRQNILKMDVSSFTKIIGNLPYYITSGIIEHLLLNATNCKIMTLMVQKEVLVKLNDKKEVSPLSLLLHYVGNIQNSNNVSKNNFVPIPHVDSAYFSIISNENIKNKDNKLVYKLMSKMFLYRRKTILNCLTSIISNKEDAQKVLGSAKLSFQLRPEQLSIENYFTLLNILKSYDFVSKIK